MNISVQKLLGKIEEELRQAKSSDSEARMREKIYAVKTLCELVLEEQSSSSNTLQSFSTPAPIQTQRMNPYGQVPKMKIDEESNGDSLFDF
ncbi:YwdI family protein [Robertmurraya kyonggiensis]|uniref:YwdI family protein n=1 Tax=Robertmurraya kyonggiensis TaxID=1037680 RepID=A0A4U1D3F7_9BACI|nr:hypothetical protein FA727_12455 [Robertmurraya kyonggiensis]